MVKIKWDGSYWNLQDPYWKMFPMEIIIFSFSDAKLKFLLKAVLDCLKTSVINHNDMLKCRKIMTIHVCRAVCLLF